MSPAERVHHERRRFSPFKCCPTSRIGRHRSSAPRVTGTVRRTVCMPQRYQRLCVAAVCALPAPRHKFKQSAPQTTTNVASPEDAYHASCRRSDRIRLPPGCRSDRSRLSVRLFPSRLRCAVGFESRAVCSQGNKYFSAPDRTNVQPSLPCDGSHEVGTGQRARRIDRATFETGALNHSATSPCGILLLQGHTLCKLCDRVAFCPTKASKFQCGVHHSERPSIGWVAGRRYLNDRRLGISAATRSVRPRFLRITGTFQLDRVRGQGA
jgi:hypothetical protein